MQKNSHDIDHRPLEFSDRMKIYEKAVSLGHNHTSRFRLDSNKSAVQNTRKSVLMLLVQGSTLLHHHMEQLYSNSSLPFAMRTNKKFRAAKGVARVCACAHTREPVCYSLPLRILKIYVSSEVEKGRKGLRPSPPVPPSPYRKATAFSPLKFLSCDKNAGYFRLQAVFGLPLQPEEKTTKGACHQQARPIVKTQETEKT